MRPFFVVAHSSEVGRILTRTRERDNRHRTRRMEIFSDDVTQMYFRREIKGDITDYSLSANAMEVLVALDESKTGAQVAHACNLSIEEFKKAIGQLREMGLAVEVEKKVACLDENFLDELQKEFATIVGPMADVLIQDVISDMDLTLLNIPTFMAADLINNLAAEIPSAQKRAEFQKNMLTKIEG